MTFCGCCHFFTKLFYVFFRRKRTGRKLWWLRRIMYIILSWRQRMISVKPTIKCSIEIERINMEISYWPQATHTSAKWYGIHKKNELAKPRMNYESWTIMWYKTPNFEGKKPADFEETYISVILYYKIDHFCPLKSNFQPFPAIWPNVWVWNSQLLSYYHFLAQLRHARSLFFPFWHQ